MQRRSKTNTHNTLSLTEPFSWLARRSEDVGKSLLFSAKEGLVASVTFQSGAKLALVALLQLECSQAMLGLPVVPHNRRYKVHESADRNESGHSAHRTVQGHMC